MGWRLDYFIASQRLQNHILKVEHRTDIGGSDHCPIVMESSLATYLEATKTNDVTPVTTRNTLMQKECEKEVTVINVPARTKRVAKINVIATSLHKGYLPRIPAKEEIYIGEGIVSNNANTCDVMVINSTEKDELIVIKPQEIHPFEYYTPFEDSAESEVE